MSKKKSKSSGKTTMRAIKIRIYPDKDQIELLVKTFGCCRYIWNHMLSDEQYFYAATDQFFIPTPAKYKNEGNYSVAHSVYFAQALTTYCGIYTNPATFSSIQARVNGLVCHEPLTSMSETAIYSDCITDEITR